MHAQGNICKASSSRPCMLRMGDMHVSLRHRSLACPCKTESVGLFALKMHRSACSTLAVWLNTSWVEIWNYMKWLRIGKAVHQISMVIRPI